MNELSTEEIDALSRALNREPPEPATLDEDQPPMPPGEEQGPEEIQIAKAQFTQHERIEDQPQTPDQLEQLEQIPLHLEIVLGETEISVKKALDLHTGSLIQLNTLAGEPVELRANGKPFATGEVVVVDNQLGVRLLSVK